MSVQPFQVDLRGVVDLLSRHVYSSPQVYLRELIQNCRDAIVARHLTDLSAPTGEIRIQPGGELIITDNGIGLTAAEATDLLATVGSSSKRDELLDLRRDDYLGQFGIGLLSAFMVADEIRVVSRSITPSPAIEWVGANNGTFTLRELSPAETDALEIGTRVYLKPRPDEQTLTTPERVRALATKYAQYLTEPIMIANGDGTWDTINKTPVFIEPTQLAENPDDVVDFGTKFLGAKPLAVLNIDIPSTQTTGLAFVLPFTPPSSRQTHRVYLGRMLLSEKCDEVLPEWAFFVRCVINTDGLTPTASREQLVENEALIDTRAGLGEILRTWLIAVARDLPPFFHQFLQVHHLSLKAMALADLELAKVLVPLLQVESSIGTHTFGELLAKYPRLRYTETVDEFRQIAAVAAPDEPVLNGGYTYEADLIRLLPQVADGVAVAPIKVHDILDELAPPPFAERDLAMGFENRAVAVLPEVEVVTRLFSPADVAGLYVIDPTVLARLDRSRARDQAPSIWVEVLSEIDEIIARRSGDAEVPQQPTLCLNWANPIIQQLAKVSDELVFDRSLKLVYIQSLLDGHQPLRPADRAVLTTAMSDIIQLSVGFGDVDF